jgi:hypothetical protein
MITGDTTMSPGDDNDDELTAVDGDDENADLIAHDLVCTFTTFTQ